MSKLPDQFTCIIPARFQSSRFPGKPLKEINGKAMIDYVYEHAVSAKHTGKVIIATDDETIFNHCKEKGFEVAMTGEEANGSERVAAVARELEDEFVFEMQGDQPLLTGDQVDDFLVRAKEQFESENGDQIDIVHPFTDATEEQRDAKHVVKAVKTASNRLIFQTRLPIESGTRTLGLYLWRNKSLQKFASIAPSELEKKEDTHPLRLYLNDFYVQGIPIDGDDWVEIDLPEQIEIAEEIMKRKGIK